MCGCAAAVLGEGNEGRAGGAARGAGRRPPAGSGTLDAWVSSAGGGVLWGGVHVPVTQSTAQNPFPWGGVRCGPWADGALALFSFLYLKNNKILKIYVEYGNFQKWMPVAPLMGDRVPVAHPVGDGT